MTTNEHTASIGLRAHWATLWAATAAEITEFKSTFGKLPGDNNVSPRERALRVWMYRQRQKEAAGKLSPEQVTILDGIDMEWRSNQVHLAWHNHLAEAQSDYLADVNSSKAAGWIAQQRARMTAGKLRPEQIQALDDAFPEWRDPFKVMWEEQAGNLRSYLSAHGKLPTSRTKDPAARQLAVWLQRQRRLQRLGTLKAYRVALLDENIPGWRGTRR